ncbi:MAG: diacylglycerol kinase catalytic region [Clostridiales bacterium]|jgi:YegS/Rv2252/BmrU family lipid kinase|nr:diacylglycerol kinase catalytic region [Clostridiales bacterium]
MSILFIVNPTAGKGYANSLTTFIDEECRKSKIDYLIKCTSTPSDGTSISRWGAEKGFDRIVAVGGDGTVNDVLNGIVGTSAALGVIPGGSGNDFIRSINKHKEIKKIINDNIYGKILKSDIGICNGKYFINVASSGFDAQVVMETEKAKKIFSGSLAYIAAVIKTIFMYKGRKVNIKIDDYILTENTLLVAVANGKYYGGGMLPAPRAELDDGYFDVCHIKQVPKAKMLLLFPRFIKGKHESIKEVSVFKGKKIVIDSNEELPVNLDGETFYSSQINFEILPKGINIIVPMD